MKILLKSMFYQWENKHEKAMVQKLHSKRQSWVWTQALWLTEAPLYVYMEAFKEIGQMER